MMNEIAIAVGKAFKEAAEIIRKFSLSIRIAMSNSPEIKAHMVIYHRTKKRRIKKKQISKIKKILEV